MCHQDSLFHYCYRNLICHSKYKAFCSYLQIYLSVLPMTCGEFHIHREVFNLLLWWSLFRPLHTESKYLLLQIRPMSRYSNFESEKLVQALAPHSVNLSCSCAHLEGHSLSTCIPVSDMEDLIWVLGSWLQLCWPNSAVVGNQRINYQVEALSLSCWK